MFAPVAAGVVKLEGSSDEKIVALEGEMRYRAFSVAIKASLKPSKSCQLVLNVIYLGYTYL